MKKHELIKHAYDNYPKGTVATYGGEPIICEGNYEFSVFGWILNVDSGRPIFDSDRNEWATIIPEQPERKFVMKSEDGVDLYEGDLIWWAFLNGRTWLSSTCSANLKAKTSNTVLKPNEYKAFSTKEAAEAWIAEQNKPAVIRLDFEGGEAIITKDKIRVHLDAENGKGYYMEATEIEPIYAAYKSLQTKQN